MERNKASPVLILSFFDIVCTFTADLQSPGILWISPARHSPRLMELRHMLSHFDVSSAPVAACTGACLGEDNRPRLEGRGGEERREERRGEEKRRDEERHRGSLAK